MLENTLVEVGQKWRDLDKRMFNRTVTITRVHEGRAYYGSDNHRRGRSLSISRMHPHFGNLLKTTKSFVYILISPVYNSYIKWIRGHKPACNYTCNKILGQV